jgi:hypothetical protein
MWCRSQWWMNFVLWSTLGQVSLLYDSDNVVALLNKLIPVWNSEPISITWFILDRPPRIFFARTNHKSQTKRTTTSKHLILQWSNN